MPCSLVEIYQIFFSEAERSNCIRNKVEFLYQPKMESIPEGSGALFF